MVNYALSYCNRVRKEEEKTVVFRSPIELMLILSYFSQTLLSALTILARHKVIGWSGLGLQAERTEPKIMNLSSTVKSFTAGIFQAWI